MEWLVVIGVVLVVGFVFSGVVRARAKNEIITCGSCDNKMTLGRFRAEGGCPRCGSDLFKRTGERTG